MCFFPTGSAEAENTSSFTLVKRIKQKKKNLEYKQHFFFAFKGRAQGEFVNNKPKLAITLISMKLPGKEAAWSPGGAGAGGVSLLVNNSPLFTYSCSGFKRH